MKSAPPSGAAPLTPIAERGEVKARRSEAALAQHRLAEAQQARGAAEAELAAAEQQAGATWTTAGALPAALTRAQRDLGERRSEERVATIAATTTAERATQAVAAARTAFAEEATQQARTLIAALDQHLVEAVKRYVELEALARQVVHAGQPHPGWPGPLLGVRPAGRWTFGQWRGLMRRYGVLADDGQDAELARLLAPPALPPMPPMPVRNSEVRGTSPVVMNTITMPAFPSVVP